MTDTTTTATTIQPAHLPAPTQLIDGGLVSWGMVIAAAAFWAFKAIEKLLGPFSFKSTHDVELNKRIDDHASRIQALEENHRTMSQTFEKAIEDLRKEVREDIRDLRTEIKEMSRSILSVLTKQNPPQ